MLNTRMSRVRLGLRKHLLTSRQAGGSTNWAMDLNWQTVRTVGINQIKLPGCICTHCDIICLRIETVTDSGISFFESVTFCFESSVFQVWAISRIPSGMMVWCRWHGEVSLGCKRDYCDLLWVDCTQKVKLLLRWCWEAESKNWVQAAAIVLKAQRSFSIAESEPVCGDSASAASSQCQPTCGVPPPDSEPSLKRQKQQS